ncbi:potassium channel family protein [Arthrobacter sp. 35W]|uniref:potassium channel family protein n=1 Tax=Arthrobacter sp. 35W TaxID=1132441 RepID=UPI001E65121D|nr:potassium channel family protein [Arthrobacter sp. 35W]
MDVRPRLRRTSGYHRGMTQDRWRRHSEWPLFAAALIFLAAYSVQVIANLNEAPSLAVDVVIWATWAVFVVDYAANLYLAPNRGRWALLRVFHRTAGNALRGRILTFVLGSAALLVYCGALAVLDAEENADGSNITNFGDALWWALVTIATVGYGDYYPVTFVGRCVAAGLMVSGIAVLGVVTASVASWLVEHVATGAASATAQADATLRQEVQRLAGQVERLTSVLEATGSEHLPAPAKEPRVGRSDLA